MAPDGASVGGGDLGHWGFGSGSWRVGAGGVGRWWVEPGLIGLAGALGLGHVVIDTQDCVLGDEGSFLDDISGVVLHFGAGNVLFLFTIGKVSMM